MLKAAWCAKSHATYSIPRIAGIFKLIRVLVLARARIFITLVRPLKIIFRGLAGVKTLFRLKVTKITIQNVKHNLVLKHCFFVAHTTSGIAMRSN
jgi:hypothetical protein